MIVINQEVQEEETIIEVIIKVLIVSMNYILPMQTEQTWLFALVLSNIIILPNGDASYAVLCKISIHIGCIITPFTEIIKAFVA